MPHSNRPTILIRLCAIGAVSLAFAGCALASNQMDADSAADYLAEPTEVEQESLAPRTPPESAPSLEQLPPAKESATATGGVSLAELEQIAKEQHPQLTSTGEAIRAAEGRARQAGRPPNPNIGASSPQLAGHQSQYNAFLSQDILTGGKLRLNSAAASVEVEQMKLAQIRTLFDVLTGVRKQFYATLALQSRVAALRELQKITSNSAKLSNDLLKGGEGARPDVLILEVEADKVEFSLQNAETSLVAARRQLAIASGAPELQIDIVSGDLSVGLRELDWQEIQEAVEQNNAELARADAEVRRSQILLDRAIVEPSPKLNLMGGYQRQVEPAQDQGLFQVTMSVPLWDQNRGGIQAARANFMQSQANYDQARLLLDGQATDALMRYRVANQQVKKYEQEIMPRTKESLQLTQQLYENGQADFLDLLAIQRTLQEVNLNYIDAQEARAAAAADLGGLLQLEQFP
ncbi:MAG: TolC family protein [Pirellulaceae bacterium]